MTLRCTGWILGRFHIQGNPGFRQAAHLSVEDHLDTKENESNIWESMGQRISELSGPVSGHPKSQHHLRRLHQPASQNLSARQDSTNQPRGSYPSSPSACKIIVALKRHQVANS